MEGAAMFRFTIRDLLWLMVLAAFMAHTWVERSKTIGERAMRRRVADALSDRDAAIQKLNRAEVREKAASRRVQELTQALSDVHIELVNERIIKAANDISPSASTR
jgi:hypothetical protein